MRFRSSVGGFGPNSINDSTLVERTAEELEAVIDTLAALPDLDADRDGICGDKGWVVIYKDQSSLICYFPAGAAVRYEYADLAWGKPPRGPAIQLSGYVPLEVAKKAVRLMANGNPILDYLQSQTQDGAASERAEAAELPSHESGTEENKGKGDIP